MARASLTARCAQRKTLVHIANGTAAVARRLVCAQQRNANATSPCMCTVALPLCASCAVLRSRRLPAHTLSLCCLRIPYHFDTGLDQAVSHNVHCTLYHAAGVGLRCLHHYNMLDLGPAMSHSVPCMQYLTAAVCLRILHQYGLRKGIRLMWMGLPRPSDLTPFLDVGWKLLTRTLFKMAAFAAISSVAASLPKKTVAAHQVRTTAV